MSTANGGAAKRVKVIEASDLKANGGAYSLEGRAPVAVYGVEEAETLAEGGAYAVEGNVAVPVYVVETPEGAIEGTVAPLPMIGVTGSAAGNVAIPVYVVGGSLSGGPAPEPPRAFNSLTAVPTGANRDDVLVTWEESEGADGYRLDYSENGTDWTEIADTTSTTYTHTTPTLGVVTHSYRITAYNGVGETDGGTVTLAGLLLGNEHRWGLEGTGWTDSIGSDNFAASGTVTAGVGKIGNAAYLTGDLVASGSADYGLHNPRTIALWFYLSADSGTIARKGGNFDATTEWVIYSAGDGLVSSGHYDAGGTVRDILPHITGLALNTWHSIIFQSNGTRIRRRVNGGAWQGYTMPSWRAAGAGAFMLGDAGGRRDEVSTWNREISDAECAAWENSGAGLSYPYS